MSEKYLVIFNLNDPDGNPEFKEWDDYIDICDHYTIMYKTWREIGKNHEQALASLNENAIIIEFRDGFTVYPVERFVILEEEE